MIPSAVFLRTARAVRAHVLETCTFTCVKFRARACRIGLRFLSSAILAAKRPEKTQMAPLLTSFDVFCALCARSYEIRLL